MPPPFFSRVSLNSPPISPKRTLPPLTKPGTLALPSTIVGHGDRIDGNRSSPTKAKDGAFWPWTSRQRSQKDWL
ncbi:hypothetical protein SKAU_G00358720 [Synaphobranchus kaupii]|uniref:Uncharacterized protein n=1 Tax=Synaphobranchus kaupii TaxID=118154 RepID=A0A9Q1EHV6_SYNKA|nr:hypothetical protein SKAU_G00358720 [Synaphobranchus kaupii]